MLIAVDAAGGEHAPREVVKAAIESTKEFSTDVALVGNKAVLEMLLRRSTRQSHVHIVPATQVISDNEEPIQAVQRKPQSSIVVGINMVRDGIADGFVSAGSTGAIVVSSFISLRIVKGIERAGLCAVFEPTQPNPTLLVDVGVNPDCRPILLVQFAQMAAVLAKRAFAINSPRVALLNNGEEEIKGNKLAKETHQLLKKTNLNFIGNVEGFDIMKGKADIIVMDGFTGNIMLKTIEGYSEVVQKLLELQEASALDRQLTGAALAQYVEMTSAIKKLDYKEIGGAFLLGVNGNVVIAHGRSRATAIKGAIHLAYLGAKQRVIEAIKDSQFASG